MINTTNENNNNNVRYENNNLDPVTISQQNLVDTMTHNVPSHIKDTPNPISKNVISFATHNVYGLNHIVKNKQIIETFNLIDADFVGITETHHKQHQQYQQLQCKYQNEYVTF